ncbi:coiled-coil domain-containing protein 57 isoform X3 [Columba livia]|uniref:coiled-coil domain-containing protein 57 isoform X3 n=1 Tax=Columba livia TaxID=8932 RepID=UPI0031BAA057
MQHGELARAGQAGDAMPASAKEARAKQFKKLKQQIRELQMRHTSLEIELYRRERSHSACLREKDALIRKYKQQLSLAAEREQVLEENNKMPAELDWQQLCENAESNWYGKSENRARSPSSAGEQGEADRQRSDCRLRELKTLLSALPVERELATQASFNHCILPEGEKQCDYKRFLDRDIPTLEVRELREQNASLRAAVAQMRREMERLDEQAPAPPGAAARPPGGQVAAPDTAPNRAGARSGRSPDPRGSLCTNEISTGTSIKVSSTNLDCVVRPDIEKGPNPKVLEENMANLNQQLPDADPGVGLQCGVSCTLQGMQNTLKEAARKISILSQEKQQLIEMGNRLRAELAVVLKEGLGHPAGSGHGTVCAAAGSLLPRELVKRTQCQLSALKHLQHRLTTQLCDLRDRLHYCQSLFRPREGRPFRDPAVRFWLSPRRRLFPEKAPLGLPPLPWARAPARVPALLPPLPWAQAPARVPALLPPLPWAQAPARVPALLPPLPWAQAPARVPALLPPLPWARAPARVPALLPPLPWARAPARVPALLPPLPWARAPARVPALLLPLPWARAPARVPALLPPLPWAQAPARVPALLLPLPWARAPARVPALLLPLPWARAPARVPALLPWARAPARVPALLPLLPWARAPARVPALLPPLPWARAPARVPALLPPLPWARAPARVPALLPPLPWARAPARVPALLLWPRGFSSGESLLLARLHVLPCSRSSFLPKTQRIYHCHTYRSFSVSYFI